MSSFVAISDPGSCCNTIGPYFSKSSWRCLMRAAYVLSSSSHQSGSSLVMACLLVSHKRNLSARSYLHIVWWYAHLMGLYGLGLAFAMSKTSYSCGNGTPLSAA